MLNSGKKTIVEIGNTAQWIFVWENIGVEGEIPGLWCKHQQGSSGS